MDNKVMTKENILIVDFNTLRFQSAEALFISSKLTDDLQFSNLKDMTDIGTINFFSDYHKRSILDLLNVEMIEQEVEESFIFDMCQDNKDGLYGNLHNSIADLSILGRAVNKLVVYRKDRGYSELPKLENTTILETQETLYDIEELISIIEEYKITTVIVDDVDVVAKLCVRLHDMSFIFSKFKYNYISENNVILKHNDIMVDSKKINFNEFIQYDFILPNDLGYQTINNKGETK